jgi:hypothetical protein
MVTLLLQRKHANCLTLRMCIRAYAMLVFDIVIWKMSVICRYVEMTAIQTLTCSRRNYGELLGHQCAVKDVYGSSSFLDYSNLTFNIGKVLTGSSGV